MAIKRKKEVELDVDVSFDEEQLPFCSDITMLAEPSVEAFDEEGESVELTEDEEVDAIAEALNDTYGCADDYPVLIHTTVHGQVTENIALTKAGFEPVGVFRNRAGNEVTIWLRIHSKAARNTLG